jgi:uncharacterized OsmC-like protein
MTREAIQNTVAFLAAHPDAARVAEQAASAALEEGLLCKLTGPAGWVSVTDMHPLLGGGGSAPPPGLLMRAAIASCAVTTIAMRAASVGIELSRLTADVDSDSDVRGLLGIDDAPVGPLAIRMHVVISGDAPAETLRDLVAWSEVHSPVSAALGQRPTMTVDVIGKTPT